MTPHTNQINTKPSSTPGHRDHSSAIRVSWRAKSSPVRSHGSSGWL